jgi:UDP-N-acetylglucosamine 4,6-dehydratase/5-epimerase
MFNNKNILITGGTGTFGKEFVKKILKDYNAKKIVVYSRDEVKHYELSFRFKSKKMRFFLGDVRDKERLNLALRDIDFIVHAAAMKQVPLSEYNPMECIKTNIIGSQNLIECALNNKVKKVLMISSDKACGPVNLYGSTKLAGEKLFIAANNLSGGINTKFSVVRYGNVSGSKGSVIPILEKVKQNKENFYLTDNKMTRFWITLEEGVDLVVKTLKIMSGGEIIIPKLKSYYIKDLAEIFLSKNKIFITGVRPGEKIDEFLFSRDETPHIIDCNKFFLIKPGIKTINFKAPKKFKNLKKNDILNDGYSSSDKNYIMSASELKAKMKMFNAQEKI